MRILCCQERYSAVVIRVNDTKEKKGKYEYASEPVTRV